MQKEAYENLVQIYQEGKHKGLKCLYLFYYTLADAHYQYAQDSNTNEAFSKAKEMFKQKCSSGRLEIFWWRQRCVFCQSDRCLLQRKLFNNWRQRIVPERCGQDDQVMPQCQRSIRLYLSFLQRYDSMETIKIRSLP